MIDRPPVVPNEPPNHKYLVARSQTRGFRHVLLKFIRGHEPLAGYAPKERGLFWRNWKDAQIMIDRRLPIEGIAFDKIEIAPNGRCTDDGAVAALFDVVFVRDSVDMKAVRICAPT